MTGFLLRHWRGALSPLCAWLVGGMLAALLLAAGARLILLALTLSTSSLRVATALELAGHGAMAAILVWAVVGIWRSYAGEPNKTKLPGRLLLLAMLWFVDWRLPDRLESAKALFQIASGHDPLGPPAAIRALGDRILVDGPLSVGASARFAEELGGHPEVRTVVLRSNGGQAMEAEMIAKAIRAAGLDTYALDHCVSACTIAMAAGRERRAAHGAKIGFQQVTAVGHMEEDEDGRFRSPVADALVAARVDRDFIEMATGTMIWYPRHGEMVDAGFLTRQTVSDHLADIARFADERRGKMVDHFLFEGAWASAMWIRHTYRVTTDGEVPGGFTFFMVNEKVCADDEFRSLIAEGATFEHVYIDRDGWLLGRVVVQECPEP